MFSNHQEVIQAKATSTIPAFTIVSGDTANDGQCVPTIVAGGTSQKMLGVAPNYSTAASAMLPVITGGIAQVLCGAAIVNNDLLTNDTNGYAIPATAVANYSGQHPQNTIGIARRNGTSGDVIPVAVIIQNYP